LIGLSLLPADAAGRLLEAAPPGAPETSAWFVVFENRADAAATQTAARNTAW
jgi:hypothetical protein